MGATVRRRIAIAGLVSGLAGVMTAGSVLAAPKTYKHRCPKCTLIQEFGTPGVRKCPNDGKTMIRMN